MAIRKTDSVADGSLTIGQWFSLVVYALQSSKVPVSAKWLALAAIAYPFTPVNIIPESIMLLGQLDDVFILIFAGIAIMHMTPEAVRGEVLRPARKAGK